MLFGPRALFSVNFLRSSSLISFFKYEFILFIFSSVIESACSLKELLLADSFKRAVELDVMLADGDAPRLIVSVPNLFNYYIFH